MKKARFALLTIVLLSMVGSTLAYKAQKRSVLVYFLTNALNATATQTLTHATTTAVGGTFKYYTFVKWKKAPFWARVVNWAL